MIEADVRDLQNFEELGAHQDFRPEIMISACTMALESMWISVILGKQLGLVTLDKDLLSELQANYRGEGTLKCSYFLRQLCPEAPRTHLPSQE